MFLPVVGILVGAGLKFNRKKPFGLLLGALMLSGLMLVASCGGSGGSASMTGTGGTPAGSYAITVTGSANGAAAQTTTLTLTVQ